MLSLNLGYDRNLTEDLATRGLVAVVCAKGVLVFHPKLELRITQKRLLVEDWLRNLVLPLVEVVLQLHNVVEPVDELAIPDRVCPGIKIGIETVLFLLTLLYHLAVLRDEIGSEEYLTEIHVFRRKTAVPGLECEVLIALLADRGHELRHQLVT
jgi:hypothetical protein